MGVVKLILADGVDGVGHEFQPAVPLGLPNAEMVVAHAQPWMTTIFAKRLRPAPILREEPLKTLLSALPIVVGIHRADQIILADLLVKAMHESGERLLTADRVIKAGCWFSHGD